MLLLLLCCLAAAAAAFAPPLFFSGTSIEKLRVEDLGERGYYNVWGDPLLSRLLELLFNG